MQVPPGPALFDGGRGCGSYVQVTGARGTILVKIDNLCPECAPDHLDLSQEAFAAIDDPNKGIVPITFHVVRNPPISGGLLLRVKEGSSAWWLGLHVDNAGNSLTSVEVADGSGPFIPLTLNPWGWTNPNLPGAGPYRVRVTDIYGQSTIATGVTLSPGVQQQTTARLF
jgi:expansin (peptidoglycan-binding protein)